MTVVKAAGILFCGLMLYILLKKYSPEYAVLAEAATVVLLFFLISSELGTAAEAFAGMLGGAGTAAAYTEVLFRVCGIALITSFAAGLCRDAGESAAASAAEFAGKVLIVSAALPVLKELTGLITEMAERV